MQGINKEKCKPMMTTPLNTPQLNGAHVILVLLIVTKFSFYFTYQLFNLMIECTLNTIYA
jgi:hypothetical protein